MASITNTLDNIAYDIITTLKQYHDDSDIDLRQVKYWIRNSRAIWLKNELNKNKPVSPSFVQDLGCLELCWSEVSMCNLPSDFKVKRTTELLPTTIETQFEPTITRVGPTFLLDARYTVVSYERIPYIGSRRFNENTIYAFWLNNHIYLACKGDTLQYKALDKVNVQGVFADPEDCSRFTKCDGTPVYTDSTVYPMPAYLVSYMKDILLQGDIRIMMGMQADPLNNAHDTATQAPAPAAGNQQQG